MTRAFIIGDSHSVLLGPALIKAMSGSGWESAGQISHVGWSTARYVSDHTWQPALATARPDVVIVILGTNDAAQAQQAYAGQLRTMVDAIKAAGVPAIVWVGPPSVTNAAIDARAERIAPWQGSFLPQMGVRWIDSRQMTGGGQAPDGIHFTAAGYRAWAGSLADPLRQTDIGASTAPAGAGSLVIPLLLAGLAVGLLVATLRVR
jgi:lysophospholipase L1-like esterase